jgi:large subunit ribosomal protein L1
MTKKSDLLEKATKLNLKVTDKNTIAEIEEAIKGADTKATKKEEQPKTAATTAKAGKRSSKSLADSEAKKEKEERKQENKIVEEDEKHSKPSAKPKARPLIERRGKKYQEAAKLIDKSKVYNLADALELATKTNPSKFDASVEIHVNLNVDVKQASQNIRSTVSLPNGTGKKIRVAVFASDTDQAIAKKAGADIIGDDKFIQQLEKGAIDFDILIATPQLMPKLGKYARLLGPRGLMPNPKSGTVTTDIAKAVKEAKAGKVEYRVDKQGIIHLAIGKVSFGKDKLEENARSFFTSLTAQKPTTIKGVFIKSISISTTQGPSVKISTSLE